ncbi:MAG: hypothetical protein V3V95_06575 [Thermodesulfobacteriota bacterium]
MTQKKILIFTLATLVFFSAFSLTCVTGEAREQPSIKKVRGEGISFQLEDEQEVRSSAIDEALKNAVIAAYDSLVMDTEISQETELMKESVFSAPLNYVLDYRVLSEGWIRHLVIEEGLPVPPHISNAEDEAMVDDILSNIGGGYGEKENDEGGLAPEQGLKLFHVWIEASVDFNQLKSDLSLTPSFEGENTSLVTILLLTVIEYDKFTSVKEAIEDLENVKEVSLDSFLKGKIVLTAEVWGNPHALLEKLRTNKTLKGFDIIPSGADRITIKGVLER